MKKGTAFTLNHHSKPHLQLMMCCSSLKLLQRNCEHNIINSTLYCTLKWSYTTHASFYIHSNGTFKLIFTIEQQLHVYMWRKRESQKKHLIHHSSNGKIQSTESLNRPNMHFLGGFFKGDLLTRAPSMQPFESNHKYDTKNVFACYSGL